MIILKNNLTFMTYEDYIKQHEASHKDGEYCMNCSPKRRGCCEKCWHKNTAHPTSRDYCIDENCSCHKPINKWKEECRK